jgi:hypothetical protein
MSRAMLEKYSHIGMAAKREAVETLSLKPNAEKPEGIPKETPKVSKNQSIQ